MYASQITAKTRLLEPVFLAELSCPEDLIGGCYKVLNRRRGMIIDEEHIEGSNIQIVKAYLPVAESFGMADSLRLATKGKGAL